MYAGKHVNCLHKVRHGIRNLMGDILDAQIHNSP